MKAIMTLQPDSRAGVRTVKAIREAHINPLSLKESLELRDKLNVNKVLEFDSLILSSEDKRRLQCVTWDDGVSMSFYDEAVAKAALEEVHRDTVYDAAIKLHSLLIESGELDAAKAFYEWTVEYI